MPKFKGRQVKVTIPEYLYEIIRQNAEKRNQSDSTFIGNVLVKHIQDYAELTPTEQEVVRLQKIDKEGEMLKYIRSKNAEKMYFIKNIRKQMYNFYQNRKYINIKDLTRNMKLNKEYAQANGWKTEVKTINIFLKKIKTNKIDHIHNPLMLEEK